MPYIPHTEAERDAMLKVVGVDSLDALFADIPHTLRPRSFLARPGLSEGEVRMLCEELAERNERMVSFLGAGYYDHAIPAAVDALTAQSAFVTAYTPYQPECSQGTLQAIFEFQTAVARLMELDCANASLYDGGTALFEATTMCVRQAKKKHRIVLDEGINPVWRRMLETYARNLPMEFVVVPTNNGAPDMDALKAAIDDETAGIAVQNPNFFGVVADYSGLFAHAREKKAQSVVAVNPILQSVLKSPGDMGADIAVAEGQPLGLPLSFGGPYLGLMACRREFVRQMPGRLVGRTHDTEGRTGYVLTLQAREQHIRRAKATSNICSNQNLCALRALVYLSLMGPEGLKDVAETCLATSRQVARAIGGAIEGAMPLNTSPYGHEVAMKLPVPAELVVQRCIMKHKVVPGYPAGRDYAGMDNVLIVACTEKNSAGQVGMLVDALRDVVADIKSEDHLHG